MSDHVRETFEWAVDVVERHPVHQYTNPIKRLEIAQNVTELVINLEVLEREPLIPHFGLEA